MVFTTHHTLIGTMIGLYVLQHNHKDKLYKISALTELHCYI